MLFQTHCLTHWEPNPRYAYDPNLPRSVTVTGNRSADQCGAGINSAFYFPITIGQGIWLRYFLNHNGRKEPSDQQDITNLVPSVRTLTLGGTERWPRTPYGFNNAGGDEPCILVLRRHALAILSNLWPARVTTWNGAISGVKESHRRVHINSRYVPSISKQIVSGNKLISYSGFSQYATCWFFERDRCGPHFRSPVSHCGRYHSFARVSAHRQYVEHLTQHYHVEKHDTYLKYLRNISC